MASPEKVKQNLEVDDILRLVPDAPQKKERSKTAEIKKDLARVKLSVLRTQVEKVPNVPHTEYTYKRSKYEVPDTKRDVDGAALILQDALLEHGEMSRLKVKLNGTADKVGYQLDSRSRKPRVKLNYDAQWRNDYSRALVVLKAKGALPELATLDFGMKSLEAMYDLPLAAQQKLLNHAIAYLRAERLAKDLQALGDLGNRVDFEITTEWMTDTVTRRATLMEVSVESQSDEVVPPVPPLPPAPPEDPDKKPISPKEMPEILERLELEKYRISRTATFADDGVIIDRESKMKASTLVQEVTPGSGSYTSYEPFFIVDKSSDINPAHYIIFDAKDPYHMSIGRMKYDNGLFKSESNYGTVEQEFHLDRSSRTATKNQLTEILSHI